MNIIVIILSCYLIAPLGASSDAEVLSTDFILQGLNSHSRENSYAEIMNRQKWLSDMRAKQALLTNEVERIRLSKELIRILQSDSSSNGDKCAAAYLIGLFELKKGIQALVHNILLISKAALDPDAMPIEGGRPALRALINIGEQAIPEVMELIETTTNSYMLESGAKVILFIKGQDAGVAFLHQALASQIDDKRKENLKTVLTSEYFTDLNYMRSGPQKKTTDSAKTQGVSPAKR